MADEVKAGDDIAAAPAFKRVEVFRRIQYDEGVAERQRQGAALAAELAAATEKRVVDIAAVEAKLPTLHKIAPLAEKITEQLDVDVYELIFIRLKKLKKDYQVFSNTMLPRLRALQEAESDRCASEARERDAQNEPGNWQHTGIWCHTMLVSCDAVREHDTHLFDYASCATWSCCQSKEKNGRGCRRSDRPDVDHLRIVDRGFNARAL